MTKFGLIGAAVQDSLSGQLFSAAYGGTLNYDLMSGDSFEELYSIFDKDYKAVNVTSPYKELAFAKVLALAKEGKGLVSGPCFKTGAANVLVHGAEGIEAHNSDFTGVILSVAEAYFPGIVRQCYGLYGAKGYIKVHQFMRSSIDDIFDRKPQALIVGLGGAGKAAAVAAAEMGFEVALMNRTAGKAEAFAAQLPEYGYISVPLSDFRNAVKECELVIYTLPVALPQVAGLTEEDFIGEDALGARKMPKVILEANYKTPAFSAAVKERLNRAGAQYVPGRRWLIWQALTGYGIMTGTEPDIEKLINKI